MARQSPSGYPGPTSSRYPPMRRVLRLYCLALLLLAPAAQAQGFLPGTRPAECAYLRTVLACMDRLGNHYSVATGGNDTWLRGYDAASGRRWAQTNTRYGRLTFFSGIASDGEIWVGLSRNIGWTSVSRLSSSSGQRQRLTCGRVSGCSEGPSREAARRAPPGSCRREGVAGSSPARQRRSPRPGAGDGVRPSTGDNRRDSR